MDETVRRAMQKWPNVPAVFGWLSLDARGYWLIKEERITNPLLIQFIERNYSCDDNGRWFFQNGPQRVYVTLAYAPWVLRADSDKLITHTGRSIDAVHGVWIDESGVIVIMTELGAATLDDRDVDLVSSRLTAESGQPPAEDLLIELVERLVTGQECGLYLPYGDRTVKILPIRSIEVPRRFGFVPEPKPASEELRPDASAT